MTQAHDHVGMRLISQIIKSTSGVLQKSLMHFNPFQEGGNGGMGRAQMPPTSFSPVTSTNVRISSQNFLTFSFDTFDKLV